MTESTTETEQRATFDVPGLAGHLAYLHEAYSRIGAALDGDRAGVGGQTIYLAGPPGCGRTTLLHSFSAALDEQAASQPGEPAPIVLAGGFREGRFVAFEEGGPAPEKVIAIVANIIELPDALHPYAELLGQVLSRGSAPLELARSLFEESQRLSPTELLPRLLGALAGERRVVCLVDDADQAPGGLWSDLLLGLADAVADDLALLLVLAVDGPARLGPHQDDEPDSLFVARRLCERGPASWHPLAPVSSGALEAWTGPLAPDVLAALLDVTRGRAAWAARHWHHWRADGVVVLEDDASARWTFSPGGGERALHPVDDVLGQRIASLAGDDDDEAAGDLVRDVLHYAALEGRTFTATAVASALGRDQDELIDLLDDTLAVDDDRPAGLVEEVGPITIDDETGKRHLWLYRFADELHWLTLHHHGFDEQERRERASRMAAALAALYDRQIAWIAAPLTRLLTIAGQTDPARALQRMADTGTQRDVLLWRAQAVVDGADPEDRADRRRASQTLVTAAGELFASDSFEDGMRFAEEAYRLAPLPHDRADAMYLTGVYQINLGDYGKARAQLTELLALRRELGDREGEVNARDALAIVAHREGEHDQARGELRRALELLRELGDRGGEAATHLSLASIDIEQGSFDRARDELDHVFEIGRELDNADVVAAAQEGLEVIDEAQRQQVTEDDGEPPAGA